MLDTLNGAWLLCAAVLLVAVAVVRSSRPKRRQLWLMGALVACVHQDAQASGDDGAAITPQFAQSLYDRVAPLRESDGCEVARFDTGRFRITVGLHAPSGAEHLFEIAPAPSGGDSGRRAGEWALAVPAALERECGATLAAIEHVLVGTEQPPQPAKQREWPTPYALLQISFVLLALGTLHILYREARLGRPSPYGVLALVLVWGAALALRLTMSPRTFLHEYYHVAETVSAYLIGDIGPAYGKTGPAVIRLAGALLGRPLDVQVIFLTNAVLASLAIPAVALLDLTLMRSWPRALCAAVLLCVLPHHLRFSAAEDLFVLAVTFGMWTLALFALYLRTRRLEDALLAALALSLAMQSRPEMLFFPAVLVALVVFVERSSWRALIDWRGLVALSVLGALLIPRFVELQQALHAGSPAAALPQPLRYVQSLVLLQAQVTPPVYWVLLVVGLAWGALRKPGVNAWVLLVFLGYTLFSFSIFDNPPYHLRSQLLPTSFTVLAAAGSASAWMELWGRRRAALATGAAALAAIAVTMVVGSQGFVTELRDQQLEWAFLERTVRRLPERATLLSAVEIGGNNLDVFPQFLLQRHGKTYQLIDVLRASTGDAAWPAAGDDLIFYQGMFCYFSLDPDTSPDPMTAACSAVHEHYVTEPLFVEDLDTQGYSYLRYAQRGRGPFRIGFYRLRGVR